MQMLRLNARLKQMFFDREQVLAKIGKAKAKALGKAGATLRLEVRRTQLRRRKKSSTAPNPPSIHSRDNFATLRNILYAFDGLDSVIVGPVRVNGRVRGRRMGSLSVPELLEKGGRVQIHELRWGNVWRESHGRQAGPHQPQRWRTVVYEPRPFMLAGMKAVQARNGFANLFARSLE